MAGHAPGRFRLALLLALVGAAAVMEPQAANVIPRPGEMGYMTGGFGEEQADLLPRMTSQFPVRMTFSRHTGTRPTDEFVADVTLRVSDSAGQTVLHLPSQGPIFLLRLPEGSYVVEAEYNGEVKTRRFDIVPGRHQELTFNWAG
jgi:hypothetical protein